LQCVKCGTGAEVKPASGDGTYTARCRESSTSPAQFFQLGADLSRVAEQSEAKWDGTYTARCRESSTSPAQFFQLGADLSRVAEQSEAKWDGTCPALRGGGTRE
jgi:hypothetical protein